jgi:drug/metabolite transporter (DMT)-like permease
MHRSLRRAVIFVAGLAFILLGVALAVLPGPLTIPPVLLGLWIWSTEFAFAERFFDSMKARGDEAWEAARRKPVLSAFVTGGGLVAAAAAVWAVLHFELADKVKDAVGI